MSRKILDHAFFVHDFKRTRKPGFGYILTYPKKKYILARFGET
jgi:hypothetical protein